MRQKSLFLINKASEDYENMWKSELDKAKTIQSLHEVFKRIRDRIAETEEELSQIFRTIVTLTKNLIDPVVQVLVKSIQEKPLEEQEKQKVIRILARKFKCTGALNGIVT